MDNVHSKDSHTPTLIHIGTAYTLYYSQPWESVHEPYGVIWESKEKHFVASSETEAMRFANKFVGIGGLVISSGKYAGTLHKRKATRLVTKEAPYRVIKEYFHRETLSLTG